MNLAHALANHPLRSQMVWGVRNRQFQSTTDPKKGWSYASGPMSWTFGAIPPGMILATAVEAYMNSIAYWSDVDLYRLVPIQNGEIIMVHGEQALREPGYSQHMETDERFERLIAIGARLPLHYYETYLKRAEANAETRGAYA